MKMKHIISSLLVVTLVACQHSPQFSVSGTIAGAEGKTLYLEHTALTFTTPMDSCVLNENGEFSLSAPAPQYPDFYRLRVATRSLPLAVDSIEEIVVSTSLDSLPYTMSIQGSDNSLAIAQLRATARTSTREQLRQQAQLTIVQNPRSLAAYYALFMKQGGEYIWNILDPADRRMYQAVATSFNAWMPEYERTKALYNQVKDIIQAERNASQQAAVRRFIDNADKILLTGHISPDGDSLGATLGLYHLLKQLGKDVMVMVPNRYPSFFEWMPGIDKVFVMEENKTEAVKIIKEADLIFCVDYNTLDRVNGMKPLIEQSKAKKIMIDHHLDPNINCDVVISHPEVSSASELAFRFMCRMGFYQEVSLETAQCIYTGMMTDTGNFSYNSNDPALYQIVSKLLEKGVTKDVIYNNVFNQFSEDRMRLMGYCLHKKMRIFPEHHTAFISLTRKELYTFNFQSGDAEGIVNLPLQISGIHYSCFMREDKVLPGDHCDDVVGKNKVKISFRSQGDRPVNIFAQEIFNGGGHANAAGGEFYGPINEAVKLFMSEYPKYFNK